MNISHPNILQLLAVEINPDAKRFSMISEMMTNGHIMTYISVEKADRRRTGPHDATAEPKTVQTLCLPSVVALSNP